MRTLKASKARVDYKRPSRINAVSLTLLVFLAALVYLLYSLWPTLATRATIKGKMADTLPLLWRANILPDPTGRKEATRLQKELTETIRKLGVKNRRVEVVFDRNKKRVAIEARFVLPAYFPWLDKTVDLPCAPRVETDAARVEWD